MNILKVYDLQTRSYYIAQVYIQYPMKNYNEKNYEKVYIHTYMYN